MSGVIPDSIITVSTPITPNGWPAPYRIISFPTRVKVTAVSFTVDSNAVGDSVEDGRVYRLAVVKGRRAKGESPNWAEDIVPFFGDAEKPQVTCSETMWRSNIVEPVEEYEWYTYGDSYVADVAQMDTDEYLTVWVFPDDGTFPEDDPETENDEVADFWASTTATISIAYTGATNLD